MPLKQSGWKGLSCVGHGSASVAKRHRHQLVPSSIHGTCVAVGQGDREKRPHHCLREPACHIQIEINNVKAPKEHPKLFRGRRTTFGFSQDFTYRLMVSERRFPEIAGNREATCHVSRGGGSASTVEKRS